MSENAENADKQCRICGKPAAGLQYGVLACRGCKEFFARAVSKKLRFLCIGGHNRCSTLASVRPRCRACRLKICTKLGMKIRAPRMTVQQKGESSPDPLDNYIPRGTNIDSPGYDVSVRNGWMIGPAAAENPFELNLLQEIFKYRRSSVPDDERDERESPSAMICDIPQHPTSVLPSSGDVIWVSEFAPFSADSAGNLDANNHQLVVTVHKVGAAAELIFGDQLVTWARYRDQAMRLGQIAVQPEASREDIQKAINYHNSDMVGRIERFLYMLPGMNHLRPTSLQSLMIGWKWLALPLIHMSVCMTDTDMYMTVGPKQYHYCRYWQDLISQKLFTNFLYKFCSYINRIGLSELERFLLIAVVMFEPDENYIRDGDVQLSILHRRYTDALFHHIQHRCSDASGLISICTKLERFFTILKYAQRIHRHYYWDLENTPGDTMEARSRVRVIQLQQMKIQQHPILSLTKLLDDEI